MEVTKNICLMISSLAAILVSVSNSNSCEVINCTCRQTVDGSTIVCNASKLARFPKDFVNPTKLTVKYDNIPVVSYIPYANLTELHLDFNNIRYIEDGAFGILAVLSTLILSHNSISSLRKETFQGLRMLTLLSLGDNDLFAIRADVFTGNIFPNLLILKLERCKIYEIADGAFSGLIRLIELNVSSNFISELPVIASNNTLESLKVGYFSGNRIAAIEGKSFENMISLEELYLDDNLISRIAFGSFSTLTLSLKTLNLRNNRIFSMEHRSLDAFVKLESLDVSYNNLSALNSNCIPWASFNESGKILIHDNPWDCGRCENVWISQKNIVRHSQSSVKCALPVERIGQNIIGSSMFNKCAPVEKSSQLTTGASLAITFVILAFLLVVVVVSFIRRRRQQRHQPVANNFQNNTFAYKEMDEKSCISNDEDLFDHIRQEL